MIIYTVNSGDTLYKIAREYGVTLGDLLTANGLSSDTTLPIGTALAIPVKAGYYKVKVGDTLYKIAENAGIPLNELLRLNPRLRPPYTIYPDEVLILPDGVKLGVAEVNGYCYTGISNETLEKVLPYLTYISVFSYNIAPDGTLSQINDERIINTAKNNNVAPLMTVANLNADDNFDSDIAYRFLRNDVAQKRFIDSLPAFLKSKGYMGVNLDFEYVYAENREDYNLFMKNLFERLSAEGLILSTALAPKTSDNQSGILYAGHDYKALSAVTDWIMLMTYDWGYVAGPPQAIAPKPQVENVLKYATSTAPSDKFLMGVPNYAYDWTLPYAPGTSAKYLSIEGAFNLAVQKGAQINYSKSEATPYFTYREGNREHIVWFDDALSYAEKLRLVVKYGLKGIGIWTVNKYNAPFFSILSAMYDIKKLL